MLHFESETLNSCEALEGGGIRVCRFIAIFPDYFSMNIQQYNRRDATFLLGLRSCDSRGERGIPMYRILPDIY